MEEMRTPFSLAGNPSTIPTSAQRGRRVDHLISRLPRNPCVSSAPNEVRKPKQFCSHCDDSSCGSGCPRRISAASSLHCALCTRPITTSGNVRSCNACRKWTHADCDTDSIGGSSVEGDYVCPSCRNSPLVADAMMTSAGGNSLAASPSSVSAHEEASRGALLDNYSAQSPTNRSSPLVVLSHLDSFNDMFSLSHPAAGHTDVSALSSPATTTATTTASNSARASPAFYLENTPSSDNDDFRPPLRRDRNDGVYSTRGGRGGHKKPGMGRGSSVKTRSTGSLGDSEMGTSCRGKRGGRGGKKNGKGTRGRRPRGGKTSSMIAVVSAASAAAAAREADQESSGAEEGRHRNDENDYIRTVVITSADNAFFAEMPVCLICGSIGKDAEGTMVSCVTCAQSYHTFCVGLHDKLNATIVKRGWRCLDCTVCEGCGDGRDESNLLLCDECDVSYHTYCLDPPLPRIPHGSWRCKWCATCRRCSKQIPTGPDTQRMEGLCETCYSLRKCPKCVRLYEVGDHIIKCQHCARWLHGKCEEIIGEDMLELAADNGFRCSLCRPQGNTPMSDALNVLTCDNVAMNKCAMEVLSRHGGAIFRAYNSFNTDPTFDLPLNPFCARTQSFDEGYDEEEMEAVPITVGISSGRGRGMRGGGPGRRVPKLGVGGFFVKIPRHRLSVAEEDVNAEEEQPAGQKPKIRRPRKPRRSQLEDNYPPAIQESFFGMRPIEGRSLLEMVVDEPSIQQEYNKTMLLMEKNREACELNEADSEALREGESLLGDITENDIFGQMEDIDFDNLDLNDLLVDGDEDEDEDTLDTNMNENSGNNGDGNPAHPSGSQSHFSYNGNPQVMKAPGGNRDGQQHGNFQHSQNSSQQGPSYPLQTNIQAHSGSRSNSQLDHCVERVNQATERWEEDEPLGERATKAAVLYANINYPQWKEQYPEWSERVKQIHRMWRSLDANSRQEYVNRARENRASRAKQPKAKRLAAGLHRPLLLGDKMASPARGSPGYYYPTQESDCGAGQGAMGGAVQMRNPQASLAHLSKEVLDNYGLLHRRSNELAKYQQAIENDLARMRKQKKNLTAKRRQLNKNNQKVDERGERIDIELSDADMCSLAILKNAIPMRQKDLEDCKRDIKIHSSSVRDFEVKNSIPPDLFPPLQPPPSSVAQQPSGLQVNVIRTPHPQPAGQIAGAMISPDGMRPPPPYSSVPSNSGYAVRPALQRYQGGSAVMQPPHSQFVSPKFENDQMCSGPPTPSSGRPGSSASTDWQVRTKGVSKKRKREEEAEEYIRPAVLGGMVADQLTSQLERDVFDAVDQLLSQVVIMVDGAEAARKSGMLKRLLESQPGKAYGPQRAPYAGFDVPSENVVGGDLGGRQLDAPKPKKKRTQQKKMPIGTANEYDLLLERISTQLRLCPQLPRRALEPIPRIDRSSFTTSGITDLPDRTDKPSIVGEGIGSMKLIFMRDYYTRMFECPVDEESLYPSMSIFTTDINMQALYQARCGSPSYSWREECELDGRCLRKETLLVDRRSRSPPMRTVTRIPDAVAPQPPHRSAFFKKFEMRSEYPISLIIEGDEEGFNPRLSFEQLMTLLKVDPHPDYQLDTPPRTPEFIRPPSTEVVKMEEKRKGDLQACRQCGSLMEEPAVKQAAKQLGFLNDKEDEIHFCSTSCYFNFVASANVALSPDDLTRAERFVDDITLAKLRQISADNFAKCLHLGKVKPEIVSGNGSNSEPCTPVSDPRLSVGECDSHSRLHVIHARELSLLAESAVQKSAEKKWKGHMWMLCDAALIESFHRLANQVRQKQMESQLQFAERARGAIHLGDARKCAFCSGCGDGETGVCGRLINADADTWVHVNCALWSQEVFENSSGALSNVEEAMRRASEVTCSKCGSFGASVRCYKLNCETHFHLPCARSTKGRFMKDKTFICEIHDDVRPEMALGCLDALRRLYVDREENQLIAKLFQHSDGGKLILRVGSLIFHQIGQLLPEQLKSFHNSEYIFPIGYSVTRIFWSPFNASEKLRYDCTIHDNRSSAEFVISYEGGREIREASATAAWNRILTVVDQVREKAGGMLRLFPSHTSGETLFGLNESAISKMTESLPGVDQLATYTFKHGGSPLMDLPLAVNPSGCARCEPRFRTLIKHKHHHSSPATAPSSRTVSNLEVMSRDSRTRGGSSALSGMDAGTRAMLLASGLSAEYMAGLPYTRFEPGQFLNSSVYSQYQKMKKEWKNNVYLARSRIQGLGLYAARDIEMNSMIIEYKGEVIRSEVGEMREKRYEAQNRGVYMFRIDEERLIDATMAGGPARYINHSCDPNCTTKLVTSGASADDKKIIIVANRPISAGEELTYDYQFDIEDTVDKIACLCGAPNCQKWMN